jgi:hypothetical protein
MIYLGACLLLVITIANVYFLKYSLLKMRIEFINSIDFDELIDNLSNEIKDPNAKDYTNSMDLRGTPTHVCPCGCNVWNLRATFDDFEIGSYFLDMECANCGSLATAPTPIDKEIK